MNFDTEINSGYTILLYCKTPIGVVTRAAISMNMLRRIEIATQGVPEDILYVTQDTVTSETYAHVNRLVDGL